MREYLSQYFIFTKGEKSAVLVLVLLSFFLLILPYMLRSELPQPTSFSETEKAAIAKLNADYLALEQQKKNNPYFYANYSTSKKTNRKPDSLFYFDPNKIDVDGWMKLGLSEKQATVIENYKSKGGKFRQPEDIRKIFVLSGEKKEELLPFVKISGGGQEAEKRYEYNEYSYAKSNAKLRLDINQADSADFEKLRGIGAKLSARIVKYRGWLGGFYEVEQLKEVWGLPDSTFQSIKPQLYVTKPQLEKIAINTATYDDFRKHPYTRPIAKQIIKYRDNNSNFQTIEHFCRVPDMSDSICKKVLPYLELK